MNTSPIILWLRRDLRLLDHPALHAAVRTGRPVIPVVICDAVLDGLGAAPKWRMERAIECFSTTLEGLGSRLILRHGSALEVLLDLVRETGATSVYWSRLYQPETVARDTSVKAGLTAAGLESESFPGFLLFEPWTVATGQGRPYSVYSPFWRAVRNRQVEDLLPAPAALVSPASWPASDPLESWALGRAMDRGGDIVLRHAGIGDAVAQQRLDQFVDGLLPAYKEDRNRPDMAATSRLSENLSYGEISPRVIWHRGRAAMAGGSAGAEHFLKELVWREFAWHLHWHAPDLPSQNWRQKWDGFPWREDSGMAEKWRRGETGIDLIDAGMRELYATGTMHNRVRMVVASYLTKHLLTDWRVGRTWFEQTLIDWDPASNAMGWQWVAGCGPDAAPYFRIFNPDTQAKTYDPEAKYRDYYLGPNGAGAAEFLAAIPRSWTITRPGQPIVGLKDGRQSALDAYETIKGR